MATHRDTIISYKKNAAKFDAHVSGSNPSPHHKYYEKPAMQSVTPDVKSMDVLCIGCGNGAETD